MTISSELNKLKAAKTNIRQAIQQNKTALKTTENFNTYPPYIAGMTATSYDNTGLKDYCEDWLTTYNTNVNSIRDYAFYKNTNLHVLRLTNDSLVTLQGTHAFEGTSLKCIAVPANLLASYKTATNWSKYANLFKADNYIVNSEKWMNTTGNNNSNGCTITKTIISDSTAVAPNGVLKFVGVNSATTAKGSTGPFFSYAQQTGTLKLTQGETYTYSFWAKGDTNLTLSSQAVCESQTLVSSTGFAALTNSWRKHTVTFKYTKTDKLTACFYVTIPASSTSTFYLTGLKLEKGSTATDYTYIPVINSTYLIEHLQDTDRTVEDIQGLTLERFLTDFR